MRSIKEDTYLYDPTGQIRPKSNKSKSVDIKMGCIIFSVGERKNSLPTLNFCKKYVWSDFD